MNVSNEHLYWKQMRHTFLTLICLFIGFFFLTTFVMCPQIWEKTKEKKNPPEHSKDKHEHSVTGWNLSLLLSSSSNKEWRPGIIHRVQHEDLTHTERLTCGKAVNTLLCSDTWRSSRPVIHIHHGIGRERELISSVWWDLTQKSSFIYKTEPRGRFPVIHYKDRELQYFTSSTLGVESCCH